MCSVSTLLQDHPQTNMSKIFHDFCFVIVGSGDDIAIQEQLGKKETFVLRYVHPLHLTWAGNMFQCLDEKFFV